MSYNEILQEHKNILQRILQNVNALPEASNGVELPELSSPATESEIFLNKQTIDQNGNILTGTFTIDEELETQEDFLTQIKTALAGKASGGTLKLQDKTVTPSDSSQNVIADSGYDGLSKVIVNAIPSSYVEPMHRQGSTTYTPTTSDQTISADTYLIGTQTIKGDSNLIAGNIKSGVSIFGVNGTYVGSGSGSGNIDIEDSFVTGVMISSIYENNRVKNVGQGVFAYRSKLTSVSFPQCTGIGDFAFYDCSNLTTISFPQCKIIGSYAFSGCESLTTVSFPKCTSIRNGAFRYCYNLISVSFPQCTTIGDAAFAFCSKLTSVSFPQCISIGNYAFSYCTKLTTVNFPECTSIGGDAFNGCESLTTVSFPQCTSIGNGAFAYCESLTSVSFPQCTRIGNWVFEGCTNLNTIYLLASSVCNLLSTSAFSYTSITSTTGSIIVPSSLLSIYISSVNWSYFSNRIFDENGKSFNSGSIITFRINGMQYEAEEGMTWGQWYNSEYNTTDLYYDGYEFVIGDDPGQEYLYDEDYNSITWDMNIIANYEYIISA